MPEPTSSDHASYVVVLRGPSGLHFGSPGSHFAMRALPTSVGPIDLTFFTRRTHLPGWSQPIRRGLVAEARGTAPSLLAAIEVFGYVARSIAPVLALSANVPVGKLTVELACDVTPGRSEREFFQRLIPDEPLVPHPGRVVLVKEAQDVLSAFFRHGEPGRIFRAMAHYADALLHWEPGQDVLALASLWMGMEALTPVALEREMARTGLSRDGLVQDWGIKRNVLDGEVRRRLLFRQNDNVYRTAKEASNAYEHSYEAFATVRAAATEVRDATARYLRGAILDLSDINAATRATLHAPPFDRPIWWSSETYVFGRLIGSTDDLAAPGQQYPHLNWSSVLRELPPDEYGDAGIAVATAPDPQVAAGVRFVADQVATSTPPLDERTGTEPNGVTAGDLET